MTGYLGGYLGLVDSSGDENEEVGPDPIPDSVTIGASVPTIDLIARALDRMCDYMRP